jgi:hypothetical protein
LIGIRRKCFNRSFVGLWAVVLMLALAGCGGDDDEEPAAQGETNPPAPTVTEGDTETEAETEPELEPTETVEPPAETEGTTSPEDQPGGAGDEEPARSLALFTGENGRITPRVVRVPAYIAIRVELRSGDGEEYALTFEGETITVSGGLGSVSTTLDGLRPGQAVEGTVTGASGKVRIEATAEPGP